MTKSNLSIVARERGKIVARRESHNIWLNFGRTWLSALISCTSFGPPVPEQDNRLAYMGFGIGNQKQNSPSIANTPPLITHYPGPNVQSDLDPKVLQLERPVRTGWSSGPTAPTGTYPNLVYPVGDVWRIQVGAPAEHVPLSMTRLIAVFGPGDITADPFTIVPLSEIGLFHFGAGLHVWNASPVAYNSFESIPKTAAMTITVTWTIRF